MNDTTTAPNRAQPQLGDPLPPGSCGAQAPPEAVRFSFGVSNSSLGDLADVALFDAILDGRFPHAWGSHGAAKLKDGLPQAETLARYLPQGCTLVRTTTTASHVEGIGQGDGYQVHLMLYPSWRVIRVAARSPELARAAGEATTRRIPVPEPDTTASRLAVQSWIRDGRNVRPVERSIEVPSWDEISRNYPASTRRQLDELAALHLEPGERHGRLIVLSGPPGVGKSMVIRALAREWAHWSAFEAIEEPGKVFGEPAYLLEIMNGVSRDGPEARYRTLVIEDADHYLNTEAGHGGNEPVGRLLNVADGWLGADNVLVLLSTNTPSAAMMPALLRPGRCLADINFDYFSPAEATEWLGAGAFPPRSPQSLAQLYERKGSIRRIGANPQPITVGQYL